MFAAPTAEPQWAALPACGHVRRLHADAVRRGDFANLAPNVLRVQEPLDLAPHPVAVPVELQNGDSFDGLAAALLTDA